SGLPLENIRDVTDDFRVAERFAAVVAVKDRDRHAPRALARDAPVGAVAEHILHPLPAPLGDPLDAVAGGDGALVEPRPIHRDEPLWRGAEDHRVVAAPAVRV